MPNWRITFELGSDDFGYEANVKSDTAYEAIKMLQEHWDRCHKININITSVSKISELHNKYD